MRIAIIGAGELGKLAAYHAKEDNGYEIAGFYDDFKPSKEFAGYPMLGKPESIPDDLASGAFDKIFIAIGYTQMAARRKYYRQFKSYVPMANILHSSCYVDRGSIIGEGVLILPSCSIDVGATIYDNVILTNRVTVAHHSEVGANSFIGPGVTIAGLVNIGESCFIGGAAMIRDAISIGCNSTVASGAVVVKNMPENSVSVGVPARQIKTNPALDI
jgi:sugar O-acyltransferase (sialic acid O-acetyltransferase NeuD family)